MMRHPVVVCDPLERPDRVLSGDLSPSPSASKEDLGAPPIGSVRLAGLGLALLLVLFWYRDTVLSLLDIWSRSDTFAHGYLVAPISGWLIWRRRHDLPLIPIVPSVFGIASGLTAGVAWLMGELAGVDSVTQFALVGMVVSLIWTVMGTAVLRAYAFPLGFLFFLVPFGEFLFPTMMDWTTDFVIWALRASGVPVYAEGRSLVIPSGHWEVVEGCSGVRYLIASMVVGSVYAYLNYRSLHKRLIFTVFSVVLPVCANWIRAWGTVMLGHFSDNRLATGVDHLVYGWVFFGIIMMTLFWIGARWQEDEAPARVLTGNAARPPGSSRSYGVPWLLVGMLAVLAWKPVLGEMELRGQHGPVAFAELSVPGWEAANMLGVPEWAPRYEGMRAKMRAAFSSGGNTVGVHIAYYRDQGPGKELINSVNRILLNKDPEWTMASYGSIDLSLEGRQLTVMSTEIRNPERRLLIWHWYWIGGRWTANDYVAKAYLAFARLAGFGDDSALVTVYVPTQAGEQHKAKEVLAGFLAAAAPQLASALKQTMDR